MDILIYLAKLVQSHKEVGLLGLGTFYKKKSPGRYDIETHSFIPPSFTLLFKEEITEQSALAEYISKERHISVDSSNYFIDRFVEELQSQLLTDNEAELGSIGKLISTHGTLSFQPAANANQGFDFYGLPQIKEAEFIPETPLPIVQEEVTEKTNVEENAVLTEEPVKEELPAEEPDAPELVEEPSTPEIIEEPIASEPVIEHRSAPEQVSPPEIIEEPIASEPVTEHISAPEQVSPPVEVIREEVKPTIESVIEDNLAIEENPGDVVPAFQMETPVVQTKLAPNAGEELLPEEKTGTPLYLKILLGFLVALIIVFVVYLLYPNILNNLNNNTAPTEVKTPTPEKPVVLPKPVDTLPKQDTIKADTLKKAEVVKPLIVPVDTIATTYEVIGSSPYKLEEANQFIANIKARHGIKAKIVSQKKGKKMKVSLATFKTKAEADAQIPALEKAIGIDGLYTFKNTHKPE